MPKKEGNLHAGHRSRVKEEFLRRGLDSFPEHRVLELLLFYAIPQGDTNELAHRLMERFGSLAGVLDASVEDLCAVSGVGEHTALLLRMIPGLCGRYVASRSAVGHIVDCSARVREVLEPYFFGARNEMVYLVCLDGKRKVLGVRKITEGSINAAEVTSRRITEEAVSLRASAVILAHNHVSGIAIPSQEDCATTRYLKQVLEPIGIELLDHVVFCDDDMISMKDSMIF
ncbi:MAG: DNA repair protein RadC [Oscillospiraceae bacterium]|nr:DNA repair protein RadC [Oscillospiraceae bacterium]